MSLFHSLLSSLQEKIHTQQSSQEHVARIFTQVLGTTITSSQIKIKEGTVAITAAPLIKMSIMLKKKELLQALSDKAIKVHTIV